MHKHEHDMNLEWYYNIIPEMAQTDMLHRKLSRFFLLLLLLGSAWLLGCSVCVCVCVLLLSSYYCSTALFLLIFAF